MSNILDAINIKVSRALDYCAKAEEKVAAEADTARNAEEALARRLATLEGDYTDAKAAFENCQANIAEQKARIDALVASLTQLGVDAGL